MGILSLFKKTKTSVPDIDQYGVGLKEKFKSLGALQEQQQAQASYYAGQLPGLIEETAKAPQLGGAEQTELNVANQTFSDMLRRAQIGTVNSVGQQSRGALSALAGQGVATTGAAAANIQAGALAQGQAGLNNIASEQAQQLLGFRQQLLNNVYTRLANRLQSTAGMQAQMSSQASSSLGTLINVSNSQRQAQMQADQFNAQMDMAKGSALLNFGSSVLSGGLGAFGSFMQSRPSTGG